MSRTIQISQLKAGDIILFVNNKAEMPIGMGSTSLKDKVIWAFFSVVILLIKKTTRSEYTHAAMCYDTATIAQASKFGYPVSLHRVQLAVANCKYAAVFRSAWAFSPARVQKLQAFLDRVVSEAKPYNWRGLIKYLLKRKSHEKTQMARLEAFFNGQEASVAFDKGPYFCSELVAACFHAIEAIDPSAGIVFDPRFASPADLVKDTTFGTFLGYLVPNASTVVSPSDEFYNKELLPANMGGI
jgi:hypothetical protein